MNSRDQLVPATASQEDLNAALAKSTKPKIEPTDLDKAIVSETYHVFPGSCLTVCVLTLFNGFTVTGESACADPGNFKADIGQTISRRNAKDKIWSLLGFQLKTKLDMIAKAGAPTGRIAKYLEVASYIGTKVIHAAPMTRQQYNDLRGWILPVGENGDDEGFLVEYTDGGASNMVDFTGYVSWSPRDVFEKAYTTGVVPEKTTHVDRMKAEQKALMIKRTALAMFINDNPLFKTLEHSEQEDMKLQLDGMETYLWHLERRIRRISK